MFCSEGFVVIEIDGRQLSRKGREVEGCWEND